MKRYEALAGPWTIRVCPECGRVANGCEHVEHAGVEPVEVEVAPSTATTGAVEGWERVDRLASWIDRDKREPDKILAYAQELVRLAMRHGGGQ